MRHTKNSFISELEELGLSTAEAQIFVVLIKNGSLGAAAIANLAGIQRSNVYPILCSLIDKGVVEGGAGYGSKFTALPPDEALPSLIVREREDLIQRERLATQLAQRMAPFVTSTEASPEELIQVVRNPKVIAERFDRLQLESKRQVDAIIKAPILNPANGNPAQQKAQRRGVHYRGLYERAAIEEPAVKPFIEGWIAAGEEARVYDSELPNKLMIFDSEIVLLPLTMPGDQMRALFIRHTQLAMSLSLLFEFLWDRAKPIALHGGERTAKPAKSIRREAKELLGSNSNR